MSKTQLNAHCSIGVKMFNLLKCIICIPLLFTSVEIKPIQEYVTGANSVQIIKDGVFVECEQSVINQELSLMLENSREMPAFSVSIHIDTIKDIMQSYWIRFQYEETNVVNDMPFDELLIKVEQNVNGFNVIRGNKGIYEGRCYYIDLGNKSMNDLYNYIDKLDIM